MNKAVKQDAVFQVEDRACYFEESDVESNAPDDLRKDAKVS